MNTLRRRLVLAFAISAIAAAGAATAAPEARFQPAFETFLRASDGDAGAVDSAATAFAEMLKDEPANPVILAYAGASTAMKAGTVLMPWKKMAYAEDGLAMLDKALALLTPAHDAPLQNHVPGTLETRFVAASTFLAVPGFMNRAARGAKLLDEVQASPLFATAPVRFRASVWMRAAKLAAHDRKPDEARRLYGLVVQAQAPQSARAATALKELGS